MHNKHHKLHNENKMYVLIETIQDKKKISQASKQSYENHFSLTHLSAILTHIGLTSYHCSDVVIQSSTNRERKGYMVTTLVKQKANKY